MRLLQQSPAGFAGLRLASGETRPSGGPPHPSRGTFTPLPEGMQHLQPGDHPPLLTEKPFPEPVRAYPHFMQRGYGLVSCVRGYF